MVLALSAAFAAPARLAAQQSAPAPTGQAATNAVSRDAHEAQPDDKAVFRHTTLVKSLARIFHLDVETTADIFEYLNFLVIFLAIVIPLVRVMPKVLRKRKETLRHDLEAARKLTEDAKARLGAVEAKLSKLDQEIASIRAQVEEEGKHDEERIKSTIEEESGRIVAAAEQEISAAAAHAQRGLRGFAANLAIEQAAKQLVLTPETDRGLIAEFVRDAGRDGAAGGQN